ncbi:MAG: zinc ribbon domain-containing protein [Gemmatimonadota bacterium]
MPTYEYRCPEGHAFEVFQRMSDDPTATCPECGRPAERQLSGGAGLLFKGSGFYITDHRDKDYKDKARKEGGSSTDSSSSGTGKTTDASKGSSGGTD